MRFEPIDIDELIAKNTTTIPGHGKVLWMNRIPHRLRERVLQKYGPTYSDVEEKLGVVIHYGTRGPQLYATSWVVNQALKALPRLKQELASLPSGALERYFVVYYTLFGLRRITVAQLEAVYQRFLAEGEPLVPAKMSWVIRFGGMFEFYRAYFDWLAGGMPRPTKPEPAPVPEAVVEY